MKAVFVLIFFMVVLASCGKKPIADFTWSPQQPKAGQEMQFQNLSKDAKKYDWNFGNMSIGSGENPVHIYEKSGDYIIDLTARNGIHSDTKTKTITIIP
ncbi:MAG: PKD domain-containing protein [Bacteroidia bacterium]|nr:PKD domain-containing protein [Bacteroidia bacterium]